MLSAYPHNRIYYGMKGHRLSYPPNDKDLDSVTTTFKALAEPIRIRIILLLRDRERSVGELVELLGAPQSTVSRHLTVLRSSTLVATRRDGSSVYYRLASAHVGDLVLEAFSQAEHERLGMLEPAEGDEVHR